MVSTRTWPVPPRDRTIHCIGDMHFGANVAAVGTMQSRAPKMLDDMLSPMNIIPVRHFLLGDMVNDGLTSQDALLLAWTAQLPAPVSMVLGGHDTWGGARTPVQAAAALGLPAVNYAVDLGFARFLSLGFDDWQMTRNIPGAGGCMDWLAAQLQADTVTPTFIGSHEPLYNTVGRTAGADEYRSIDTGFFGPHDDELRSVIGSVPNVKAFISGHTHSPLFTPELVTKETIGASTLACVNTSSTAYQYSANKPPIPNAPLESLYLTWLDKPDRIQIRFRSHGGRQWMSGGADGLRMIEVVL